MSFLVEVYYLYYSSFGAFGVASSPNLNSEKGSLISFTCSFWKPRLARIPSGWWCSGLNNWSRASGLLNRVCKDCKRRFSYFFMRQSIPVFEFGL